VSLAHNGVLFLDELPEFPRIALDALRQPLEDGIVAIGRAAGRAEFPARVLLVGAMNPCPCGWHGSGNRCRCSLRDVQRYQTRVPGPVRDRFDLSLGVAAVDPAALVGAGEGPALAFEAMERALRAQRERFRALGLAEAQNARLPASELPAAARPARDASRLLVVEARARGLSGRGVHRVLRVARTIADLDSSDLVEEEHLLEALALRG
jgi:magnesium chelatase family protein